MPSVRPYQREIVTLHEFFVDWYDGALPESAFARMEEAMAADLEMVSPGSGRLDRQAVLDHVRGGYDRDEPADFEIDIRNVSLIEATAEGAMVQYEEWQRIDGEWEGRVSVALLRENEEAPEGLTWAYVQSTMLED